MLVSVIFLILNTHKATCIPFPSHCQKDVLKGRLSTLIRLLSSSLLRTCHPSPFHRVTTSLAFPWPAQGPDLLNNKCSVSHNCAPAKKKKERKKNKALYTMPRLKPSPHFTRMPVFRHYEFLEETIIKIVQVVYSHHIYIILHEELY